MKIVAFAASTSSQSINKMLVTYVANKTASRVADANIDLLDLNDYELPVFSEDIEKELGAPKNATDFLAKIGSADVLIIAFAEHNGLYSAAYKNLFDWCSRQAGRAVYQDKPVLLLATSPGARGAKSVLELATSMSPRFGGDVRDSISLPSFHDNFDLHSQTLSNAAINEKIESAISKLLG